MKFIIRKAFLNDAEDIYSILLPYSDNGVILKRSKEDIEENIENFLAAEINNSVAGVISYYNYSNNLKEVRSLAVNKKYYKKGIGAALLMSLINDILKNYPKARIFALSYIPQFFIKNGFIEIPKDSLPEKIWKDCRNCAHRQNCNETALLFSKQ